MRPDDVEQWIEHGVLRVSSTSEQKPYVMRFVRPDEIEDVYALHTAVASCLHHPHAFRQDSRAFMEQQIERRGRTVGVFCEGRIVAYAAISFPDDDPDNLGRDLPLPESELPHVADYDGSAVHPDYRGNRLQQMMTHVRHDYALRHHRHHILGTVSPFNPMSLQNFLKVGCRVRNLKQKYGGMLRFIIHRDLRDRFPPQFEPHSPVDVPLTDIDLHRNLLLRGFVGFRLVSKDGEPALRYGIPAEDMEAAPDLRRAAS